jgi:transposase-like protein
MKQQTARYSSHVIGPDGDVLTAENLPPQNLKAEVIAAVNGGLLTMAEACARYGLSVEELLEWQRHYEAEGLEGLRASHHRHDDAPPDRLH